MGYWSKKSFATKTTESSLKPKPSTNFYQNMKASHIFILLTENVLIFLQNIAQYIAILIPIIEIFLCNIVRQHYFVFLIQYLKAEKESFRCTSGSKSVKSCKPIPAEISCDNGCVTSSHSYKRMFWLGLWLLLAAISKFCFQILLSIKCTAQAITNFKGVIHQLGRISDSWVTLDENILFAFCFLN